MSDSDVPPGAERDDFEPVTVDTEHISVEKDASWYSEDAVQVTITAASQHDEPVELRLVDHLPAEDGPVEVEFHPHYDPKHWTRSTPRDVVYEVALQPGEERETVYGFKVNGNSDVSPVQDSPTVDASPVELPGGAFGENDASEDGFGWDEEAESSVENGTAPESAPGNAEAEPDEVTADDGIAQDGRPEPGPSVEASAEPVETGSTREGSGSEAPAPQSNDDFYRGGTASEAGETQSAGPDIAAEPDAAPQEADVDGDAISEAPGAAGGVSSVAESLEAALEAGTLDEDDLDELRSQLGLAGPTKRLERELEDLRDTVDDLGSVRDTLDELTDERDETSTALDDLRAKLETAAAERASLADDLSEVTALVETVDAIEGRMESLHDQVETVETTVSGLEDRHEAEVDRLEERLDAIQHDLEQADGARQSEIERLREDIREWEQWREQFTEAIQTAPSTDDSTSGSIF